MKFNRLSKFIIFAMTGILFLLSLLFFVSKDAPLTQKLSDLPALVVGQSHKSWNSFGNFFGGLYEQTTDFFRTYEENQALKQVLSQMDNQDDLIENLEIENAQLREQLKIQNELPSKMLFSAKVIYRSTLAWQDFVMLNLGENDGVSEEMLVLSEEGLVGTINQVNSETAQVELLTNSVRQRPLAVKVVFDACVNYGMVLGYDEERSVLKLGQFNKQETVPIGAEVLTSGLDKTGLSDIVVGKVKAVRQGSDQSLEVDVQLAVDFSNLSHVAILGEK